MEKIYILLTATNTLFARAIRFYKHAPYSHASISFDSSCKELYSFSRKYTNNPFIGCFKKEALNENVFGKYPNSPCELLEISVTPKQFEDIKKIVSSMNGKKYNVRGIACNLLHIPHKSKDKYFCSEFVAYTLKETNVYDFKKPLNFVEPINFLSIPTAKSIYKGRINQIK